MTSATINKAFPKLTESQKYAWLFWLRAAAGTEDISDKQVELMGASGDYNLSDPDEREAMARAHGELLRGMGYTTDLDTIMDILPLVRQHDAGLWVGRYGLADEEGNFYHLVVSRDSAVIFPEPPALPASADEAAQLDASRLVPAAEAEYADGALVVSNEHLKFVLKFDFAPAVAAALAHPDGAFDPDEILRRKLNSCSGTVTFTSGGIGRTLAVTGAQGAFTAAGLAHGDDGEPATTWTGAYQLLDVSQDNAGYHGQVLTVRAEADTMSLSLDGTALEGVRYALNAATAEPGGQKDSQVVVAFDKRLGSEPVVALTTVQSGRTKNLLGFRVGPPSGAMGVPRSGHVMARRTMVEVGLKPIEGGPFSNFAVPETLFGLAVEPVAHVGSSESALYLGDAVTLQLSFQPNPGSTRAVLRWYQAQPPAENIVLEDAHDSNVVTITFTAQAVGAPASFVIAAELNDPARTTLKLTVKIESRIEEHPGTFHIHELDDKPTITLAKAPYLLQTGRPYTFNLVFRATPAPAPTTVRSWKLVAGASTGAPAVLQGVQLVAAAGSPSAEVTVLPLTSWPGKDTFRIELALSNAKTLSLQVNMGQVAAVSLTLSGTLPPAVERVPYSATFTANNGVSSNFTWAMEASTSVKWDGELGFVGGRGKTYNGDQALIQGTPGLAGAGSTFGITLTVSCPHVLNGADLRQTYSNQVQTIGNSVAIILSVVTGFVALLGLAGTLMTGINANRTRLRAERNERIEAASAALKQLGERLKANEFGSKLNAMATEIKTIATLHPGLDGGKARELVNEITDKVNSVLKDYGDLPLIRDPDLVWKESDGRMDLIKQIRDLVRNKDGDGDDDDDDNRSDEDIKQFDTDLMEWIGKKLGNLDKEIKKLKGERLSKFETAINIFLRRSEEFKQDYTKRTKEKTTKINDALKDAMKPFSNLEARLVEKVNKREDMATDTTEVLKDFEV